MQLGTKIRELRLSKGLTGRGLAVMAGISPSFLSQIEHGHTGINLETLQNISNALEIHISKLFAPEPEPEPEHQLKLIKDEGTKLDSVSKKILLTIQNLSVEQKKDLLKQAEKEKLINRLLKGKK